MTGADFLFIDRLEEACRIGTTVEERAFPQIVFVSLKIYLDLKRAGQSDDLSASVDYAAVCDRVRVSLKSREYALIETVAEAASKVALSYSNVEAVEVRAEKRVLPGTASVGAQIMRRRKA